MTTVRRRSLADDIAGSARFAHDVPTLAAAVWEAVRRSVPFDFACVATMDPSTALISGAHKSRDLEIGDEEWSALEYGGPDLNLLAEIARRPEPVGVLSVDTGGQVADCRRFRELLTPRFGFTDEVRVVFRSGGLPWAAIALYRREGEPPFTAADGALVVAVHEQVAALFRQAVFAGHRADDGVPHGPAVIVVDAHDRVVNITDTARIRIDDLGGLDHGSLPATVLAATASARTTAEVATTRAVGGSGTWLSVRATRFAPSDSGRDDVVVTLDAAAPADISALALAARGLSGREQDVARLVLQGADTKAIAASLHLSPHTVQDHLKSVFAKLGVNSRREMVRQLVLS